MRPKRLNIWLYDAFTSQRFGGNIAGVVLDADTLSTVRMQQIAAELAAPTTGFLTGNEGELRLRFFTSTTEIDMCGHVVVGVSRAILDQGRAPAPTVDGTVRFDFHTKAGLIKVTIEGREADRRIMMVQNPPKFTECNIQASEIIEVLGIRESDLHPSFTAEVVYTALNHLIIPVRDVEVLSRIQMDVNGISDWSERYGVETVPVVALHPETNIAARSRDLCAGIGNIEEAASGTTNGAISSWMYKNGVLADSSDRQITYVNQQGVEMGRPSEITCILDISNGSISRVSVGGKAVKTLEGVVLIE